MSFGKEIEKFASQFVSSIEDSSKKSVNDFLVTQFGDEFVLITSYKFDGDISKFTEIDAPEHIINKLSELGYCDL